MSCTRPRGWSPPSSTSVSARLSSGCGPTPSAMTVPSLRCPETWWPERCVSMREAVSRIPSCEHTGRATARMRVVGSRSRANGRPITAEAEATGDAMPREAMLARTFVEMADTLVADFDVVELLTLLTDRCVDLLDVEAAGLMLIAPEGDLRVMASSSEA